MVRQHKVTHTSGTGPQRNRLCIRTNNSVCNPDTHLHLDRGWTHNCPALQTHVYGGIWLLSCWNAQDLKVMQQTEWTLYLFHSSALWSLVDNDTSRSQAGPHMSLRVCRVPRGIPLCLQGGDETRTYTAITYECTEFLYLMLKDLDQALPVWQRFPLKPLSHSQW